MAWNNYERIWGDRDKSLNYEFYSVGTHSQSTWSDLLVMNNGKSVLNDPKYSVQETFDEDGRKLDNSVLHKMRSDIIGFYEDYIRVSIQMKQDWCESKWFVYNEDERPHHCTKNDEGDFYLLYGEMGNAEIAKTMEYVKGDFCWRSIFDKNYQHYLKTDLGCLMFSYILYHTPKTQYKSLLNLCRFDSVFKKFTEVVLKPVKYTYKLSPSNSSFEKELIKIHDKEEELVEKSRKLQKQLDEIKSQREVLWRT